MRDIFTDLNAGAEKFEAEWLPPNSMVSATLCVCVCVLLLLLLFLTLCCSYLKPYCMDRKTMFFSMGI